MRNIDGLCDAVFMFLVLFMPSNYNLPDVVTDTERYKETRKRFLVAHEINDFAIWAWWLDKRVQPHRIRGALVESTYAPRSYEASRFAFDYDGCNREINWAKAQAAHVAELRESRPDLKYDCDAWERYLTVRFIPAFEALREARGCELRDNGYMWTGRVGLRDLRTIVGDDAFRDGVMPSRGLVCRD